VPVRRPNTTRIESCPAAREWGQRKAPTFLMERNSVRLMAGSERERDMEYRDRVLRCMDCGAEFVFTAGEQLFFADRGFKNQPKRCKP
jgi:hypothetical protein